MTKICKKCKKEKETSEFWRKTCTKDGLQPSCIECNKNYHKSRRKRKEVAVNQKYCPVCKEVKNLSDFNKSKGRKKGVDWLCRECDKQRGKRQYQSRRDKIAIRKAEYRRQNRDKCRKWKKTYMNSKPEAQIKERLRSRIIHAVKKGAKSASTLELLGCSTTEFKIYFESLFTEGMNWDEFMQGNIVIDHKKPCCSFDLTQPEEQRKCFHWSNLQPLWRIDNTFKSVEDKKLSIWAKTKTSEISNSSKETIDF